MKNSLSPIPVHVYRVLLCVVLSINLWLTLPPQVATELIVCAGPEGGFCG